MLEEHYYKTYIRCCWKGVTKFMFWESFSYDKKESCHIWKFETAQEKKAAEAELAKMNTTQKSEC